MRDRDVGVTRGLIAIGAVLAVLACAGTGRAASIQTFQVPSANAGLHDITTGPDGNVYFTEDQDVLDPAGDPIFHVGELTTGGGVAEFPVPFGDADSTGDHMGPTSITASGGRLWFLSDVGGSLYAFGPGGAGLAKVGQPTGNGFESGEEITPAPDGGVWATTIDGAEIEHFDPAGTETDSSVNANPGTIATAPGGGVAFGQGSAAIDTLDAAGQNPQSFPLPSDIDAGDVYAMAYDRSGDLWYSTYLYDEFLGGSNGTIGVLRPGAATAQTVAHLDPANGRGPFATDMVLGPDGAIWFTWTSTPDGVTAKVPSGIGRLNPANGQVQLFDTVKSNSVLPGGLAFGGDGSLYFYDRLDNLVGRVTDPSSLFGATAGGGTGTTAKKPQAPKLTLTVPKARLRTLARHPSLTVRCRLRGAGRCAVAAQVPAKVARGLHVMVAKKAKTATLGRGSHTFKRAGTAKVTVRFSRALARRIARRRSLKLTFAATSSSKGHRNRTARRTVTLRH